MTAVPTDPAASVRAPVAHRGAARASVPGGSSSAAAPAAEEDGKTSPQRSRERAAEGTTPGPDTAPPPSLRGQAAVRARVKTPAGSAPDADDALSAGSRTAIAAAMSENRGPDSLDAHVRKLMKDLGLRGYHTHDSRRSPDGFPDWVITGKRTIYRELKREGKNPTEAQQDWLDALAAAGDDTAVWRPSDLLSGRIQAELVAISWLGGM